jgi:hypothetical protein
VNWLLRKLLGACRKHLGEAPREAVGGPIESTWGKVLGHIESSCRKPEGKLLGAYRKHLGKLLGINN